MLHHSSNSASPSSSSHIPSVSDHKRKRERHVLSCLDCRRRKVKCDRQFPVCGRCEKGGNAGTCTYKSRWAAIGEIEGDEFEVDQGRNDERAEKQMRLSLGGNGNGNAPILNENESLAEAHLSTISTHETTIKRLESRLADLERMVAQGASSTPRELPVERASEAVDIAVARGKETSLFKGRGFRTQFYGASSPTSLLAHVRSFYYSGS